jgi:serine/threonine-protein kinase RsbW
VLVNIVSYAFSDEKAHLIRMAAGIENEHTLIIEIDDDGACFNPLEMVPEPDIESDIKDRPIGGLDIHLVKTMMDQVVYDRREGKNILIMEKNLVAGMATIWTANLKEK